MLAIVWHSRTGAARAMARAAAKGAGDQAKLIPAETATPNDLLAAAGYLFICPENLATMSGAMKEMSLPCGAEIFDVGAEGATLSTKGSPALRDHAGLDRVPEVWVLICPAWKKVGGFCPWFHELRELGRERARREVQVVAARLSKSDHDLGKGDGQVAAIHDIHAKAGISSARDEQPWGNDQPDPVAIEQAPRVQDSESCPYYRERQRHQFERFLIHAWNMATRCFGRKPKEAGR